MQRIDVIGCYINNTNMDKVLENIMESIENTDRTKYICVSNVHTTVMGRKDPAFRHITNNAFMAVPDGMPLVWLGRLMGKKSMKRCSGPDLMAELFELSEKKGYSHFFYGTSWENLEKLQQNLNKQYPNLKISGMYAPPFRPLSEDEDEEIIKTINECSPNIIWVGLGAPKQEIWMAEHVDKVKASLLIGVGAAFNFHAGTVKRAPLWMQNSGMEWLYRLIQEPGRLWKRYLVTNTQFVFYVVAAFLKKLLGRKREVSMLEIPNDEQRPGYIQLKEHI